MGSQGGDYSDGQVRLLPWIADVIPVLSIQTIGKLQENTRKASSGDIKAEQLDAIDQFVTDTLLNRAYGGEKRDPKTLEAARKVCKEGI